METNSFLLKEGQLKEFKINKPLKVLGIDLGTTNSTITEITWLPLKGSAELPLCQSLEIEQPTTEGIFTSPLVPSVVAILPSGDTWVGEGAKRLRADHQQKNLIPEKTIFFDTKNDMGLKKSYFLASESYNSAWKIAGHILAFLRNKAQDISKIESNHIVVTVPASFQLNQRRDTLLAAKMAGLYLKEHDLLDEPTAALLDYLMTKSPENIFKAGIVSNVLVFDFGGGTCDVSIVRIEIDKKTEQLKASMLSVSRYHRLGGGDIDAAIVHEYLIPEIIAENNLSKNELTWSQKKKGLESQLLTTAESLKIALCKEIDRLKKHGKYDSSDKTSIIAKQPGLKCRIGAKQFTLTRPQLSASDFEKILEPFLDTEFLFARETEYRLTQSIFAPIQDALERTKLTKREIDFVLLVGGSTLIPQVKEAIEKYFSESQIGVFDDYLDVQLSVSRGAAWHAFFLEVMGRPFIQPVVSDTIAMVTGEDTPYTLIPAGMSLPYPPDGSYARLTNLAVPETLVRDIKMEIIALSTKQPLFSETWHLEQVVNAGEPITIEFKIDSNQEFECRAHLTNNPKEIFTKTIENPLFNIVSPNKIRLQIEELEEEFRQKRGFTAEDREDLIQISKWYAELKQLERAQEYLKTALRLINHPDAEILNLQGINYGQMGDIENQIKAYKEADKVSPYWGGPMFNLALTLRQHKRYDEALEAANKAIEKEKEDAAYYTLKGLCLKSIGKEKEAYEIFHRALKMYRPVEELSDWELGWLQTCSHQLNNKEMLKKINMTMEKRKTSIPPLSSSASPPIVTGGIQKTL